MKKHQIGCESEPWRSSTDCWRQIASLVGVWTSPSNSAMAWLENCTFLTPSMEIKKLKVYGPSTWAILSMFSNSPADGVLERFSVGPDRSLNINPRATHPCDGSKKQCQ